MMVGWGWIVFDSLLTCLTPSHHSKLTMYHYIAYTCDARVSPDHHPTINRPSPDHHPTCSRSSPDHHPTITCPSPDHHPTTTRPTPYHNPVITRSSPDHFPTCSPVTKAGRMSIFCCSLPNTWAAGRGRPGHLDRPHEDAVVGCHDGAGAGAAPAGGMMVG